MDSLTEKTDEELMWEYVQGDYNAFECLYQRHSKKVFGYIMTKVKNYQETQDIFQTVFRKLHQSRSLYKKDLPVLPWLFTICRNTIIDNRRKFNLTTANDVKIDDLDSLEAKSSSRHQEFGELEDVKGFDQLSGKEQEVIRLKYDEEMNFKEIAEHLGYSEANSRKISSRAILKLKNILKGSS